MENEFEKLSFKDCSLEGTEKDCDGYRKVENPKLGRQKNQLLLTNIQFEDLSFNASFEWGGVGWGGWGGGGGGGAVTESKRKRISDLCKREAEVTTTMLLSFEGGSVQLLRHQATPRVTMLACVCVCVGVWVCVCLIERASVRE